MKKSSFLLVLSLDYFAFLRPSLLISKHPGMAEIRMGVSLQSALDKVKHKKAMAKQRKLGGKGGKKK